MKVKYSTLLLTLFLPQVATAQSYVCKACPAGTYGGNGKTCTPCPAGTASNKTGVASCPKCNPGTYSTGTGNKTCTPCSATHYSNWSASCGTATRTRYSYCETAGSTSNTAKTYTETGNAGGCPTGYECVNGRCQDTKCGAGFYKKNNSCVRVEDGYYSPNNDDRKYSCTTEIHYGTGGNLAYAKTVSWSHAYDPYKYYGETYCLDCNPGPNVARVCRQGYFKGYVQIHCNPDNGAVYSCTITPS